MEIIIISRALTNIYNRTSRIELPVVHNYIGSYNYDICYLTNPILQLLLNITKGYFFKNFCNSFNEMWCTVRS